MFAPIVTGPYVTLGPEIQTAGFSGMIAAGVA